MLVWLALYVGLQWYFVKAENVSTEQADALSTMTGRIVDSYTNITTVKLFVTRKRSRIRQIQYADIFRHGLSPDALSNGYKRQRANHQLYARLQHCRGSDCSMD